jgi:hypothetical protein
VHGSLKTAHTTNIVPLNHHNKKTDKSDMQVLLSLTYVQHTKHYVQVICRCRCFFHVSG